VLGVLRYQFLKTQPQPLRCSACGMTVAEGAKLCVDHIRPIRHHWYLRLEASNFQLMCTDCNLGKGSDDEQLANGFRRR
jgi:hypothetical protein